MMSKDQREKLWMFLMVLMDLYYRREARWSPPYSALPRIGSRCPRFGLLMKGESILGNNEECYEALFPSLLPPGSSEWQPPEKAIGFSRKCWGYEVLRVCRKVQIVVPWGICRS